MVYFRKRPAIAVTCFGIEYRFIGEFAWAHGIHQSKVTTLRASGYSYEQIALWALQPMEPGQTKRAKINTLQWRTLAPDVPSN